MVVVGAGNITQSTYQLTHLAEAVVAVVVAAAAAASAGDFCQPSVISSGCRGDTRYHTVHISNNSSSAAASAAVVVASVVAVVAYAVVAAAVVASAVAAAVVAAAVNAVCLDSGPVVCMDHLSLGGQET